MKNWQCKWISSSEQDWLRFRENVEYSICETDPACIPPSEGLTPKYPRLTKNDHRAVEGKFIYSPLGFGLHWEKTKQLYLKLLENPVLLGQDVDVDDFFTENSIGVIGLLTDIFVGINQLSELSESNINIVKESLNNLDSNRTKLAKLDAVLFKDAQKWDNIALFDERIALTTMVSDLSSAIVVIIEEQAETRNARIVELIDANALIPVQNPIVQYEKLVNDVYLRTIASGLMELSGIEASMIYDIANSCALDFGGVVYRARSLYKLVNDTVFWDENLCDILVDDFQNESRPNPNLQKRLLILPNPTYSFVNLSWPIDLESVKKVRVEILRPMGELVKVIEFSGSLGQKTFELPMQSGIYTVNFYIDGLFVENQTLIIIE